MNIDEKLPAMSISSIAEFIWQDWVKLDKKTGRTVSNINYAAKPYLDAMLDLESINDMYGADKGREIVAYFLSNASTYRGENAKLIKAELNRRVKEVYKNRGR